MILAQKSKLAKFLLNISLFRRIYIIALYFCSFHFICAPAVVLKFALMAWGIWLIYYYYIKSQRILQVFYSRWILAFIGSTFLTAVFHVLDNFLPNLLMLVHVAICFYLFYGMHTERNKKRIKHEIYFLSLFIALTTTVLNFVGLVMVFITGEITIEPVFAELFGQTFQIYENGSLIIFENRFSGLTTNPNLLGFYTVVAIFCTHMLTKSDLINASKKKSIPKWMIITFLAVNLFCLFLSDSNAALLLLAIYTFGILLYRFFGAQKSLNIRIIIKKTLALLGCFVLIAGTLFVSRTGANAAFSLAVKNQQFVFQMPNEVAGEIKDIPITFQHINKNVGSGRDKLFMEGLKLFTNYPLLGVGKENLVTYGSKHIEDGLHFPDLHNGYLTILVSSGVVGFVFFIGFALHLARHCVKSLFLEQKSLRNNIFPCLFAFILGYCVYSTFEKALLYDQTFMVVFFWLVLGYAGCYMKKYDHLQDRFDTKALFNKKENENLNYLDEPIEDE